MTDDLCQSVLVYRSPLRKLDTSSNQLCASLDNVRASGKLLSFSVAGTCGDCGQSTAGGGGFTAHPVKISSQIISPGKSNVTLLPGCADFRGGQCLTFTIRFLKFLGAGGVIFPQGGDILPVECGGILVACDSAGKTRTENAQSLQDVRSHLSSSRSRSWSSSSAKRSRHSSLIGRSP